jgi:hypothetical protein
LSKVQFGALICTALGFISGPNKRMSLGLQPGEVFPDLAKPSPYTYTYAVNDDYSNANFQHEESNDGTGAVAGSYSVHLPDGRI